MRNLLFTLALAIFASPTLAASWGYTGLSGPDHWGSMGENSVCDTGFNQSPVDIRNTVVAELQPLIINYQTNNNTKITNNGHTIQLDFDTGNSLNLDSDSFNLVQMHFHAPSEHTINGQHYPFEAHLVHANKDGDLAVVGLLFATGPNNPVLAQFWDYLPHNTSYNFIIPDLQLQDLLPADLSYHRLSGSLTTPPCTEGVRWIVLASPSTIGAEQVAVFKNIMGSDTNRPVQALNGRVILR